MFGWGMTHGQGSHGLSHTRLFTIPTHPQMPLNEKVLNCGLMSSGRTERRVRLAVQHRQKTKVVHAAERHTYVGCLYLSSRSSDPVRRLYSIHPTASLSCIAVSEAHTNCDCMAMQGLRHSASSTCGSAMALQCAVCHQNLNSNIYKAVSFGSPCTARFSHYQCQNYALQLQHVIIACNSYIDWAAQYCVK